MAGAILISENEGVSLNGRTFRRFIEAIRSQLINIGAGGYVKEIYFGNDESFSDFISVVEQEREGFNLFYDAVMLASQSEEEREETASDVWREILDLLRSDPRWDRSR